MCPTDTSRVRQARLTVELSREAVARRPSAWADERLEFALAELERAEAEAIVAERGMAVAA